MKCTECNGAGETPITYESARKRERGQLALAWQRCLFCGGTGSREREPCAAMKQGRVIVRSKGARAC